MRFLLTIAMVASLTGCHRGYLTCRSEYLEPTHLASERINTPDPCKECFYGQQIIVHWSLPRHCSLEEAELHLHLRYGNRASETLTVPITTRCGFWTYRLLNEDYWCHEGITAYQASLTHKGALIETWNHSLWAEILILN